MARLYLLLGGNLGEKKKIFEKTYQIIEREIGKITEFSSIYETEPWGFESDDMFWNQALLVETNLKPEEILPLTKQAEKELGREESSKGYTSRKIDIDILFYNNIQLEVPGLVIPHPQITNRKFVLVPMAEIAPSLRHPGLDKSIQDLLADCKDELAVQRLT